ncbi:hypothetical protein, partial [Candidatus Marinarcus aquaticus]|uniref:hypothetical protein n=1 Tax=Candidatus Marinarcus aquaticus TaxID=2044504 RepID=UPI001D17B908
QTSSFKELFRPKLSIVPLKLDGNYRQILTPCQGFNLNIGLNFEKCLLSHFSTLQGVYTM